MDDDTLQNRLARIERRLNLVIALLVGASLVALGELLDYYVVGVLAAVSVVLCVAVAVSHRRRRSHSES